MNLVGSTSFGFAQNTTHDCQNTVLNSKWHCLRQMPQKKLFTSALLKLGVVWQMVKLEDLHHSWLCNSFPNKPWFLRVCSTSLLKTSSEKEKLLLTSNFSFSHSVFFPSVDPFATFIQFEIVVCELFEFRRVVWESVKPHTAQSLVFTTLK